MVIDNSKFPPAYINPFMDKLYEWGYAEGLWDDKRELLQDLDGDAFPFESLKSFLIENDIPEWYYEGGWGMSIGAEHYGSILNAWKENSPYGGDFVGPETFNQGEQIPMGNFIFAFEQWDNNVRCVGIKEPNGDIWWYNPIIFTPTQGKSWFGDLKLRPQFYSLNWKENPFDSIK